MKKEEFKFAEHIPFKRPNTRKESEKRSPVPVEFTEESIPYFLSYESFPVVQHLLGLLTKKGNKSAAKKQLDLLLQAAVRHYGYRKTTMEALFALVDSFKPYFEMKTIGQRRGQIPFELSPRRQQFRALKALIKAFQAGKLTPPQAKVPSSSNLLLRNTVSPLKETANIEAATAEAKAEQEVPDMETMLDYWSKVNNALLYPKKELSVAEKMELKKKKARERKELSHRSKKASTKSKSSSKGKAQKHRSRKGKKHA